MNIYTLLSFLLASAALTIAPGPDNIFVITQGITSGRKAAIVTALGMCSGITVHTTAAALGISALFYSSTMAFNLVKYAGALYLLYLAIKILKNRSSLSLAYNKELPAVALFRRGFVMNVLNPKVALFFLAFLPQFTAPDSGKIPLQLLALGGIFMIQASIIFTLIGWFSGSIGSILLSRPGISRHFDLLTAVVFASLGIRLALSRR